MKNLGALTAKNAGLRIVDKGLSNIWLVGHIISLLPSARVITMKRHPLDVALSRFFQPFNRRGGMSWSSDLSSIASFIAINSQMSDLWDKVFGSRNLHVYYEDLVTNPRIVLKEILTHIELDWEGGVLDSLVNATRRSDSDFNIITVSASSLKLSTRMQSVDTRSSGDISCHR